MYLKKEKRWLTTTIFLSVTCCNVTMLTTNYYSEFFELDFSGLLANCSDKGRTGYNPIMMYAVVTYANMRGIRSVDRIVDLCERDLAFIWLTRGQKPKRDAPYDFKTTWN